MKKNFLAVPPVLFTLCIFAAVMSFALIKTVCGAEPETDKIYSGIQKYRTKYVEKLEELAKWCDENGLETQAEATRRWASPEDAEDEIRVSPLPSEFWEKNASESDSGSGKSLKSKKNQPSGKNSASGKSTASGKNSASRKNAFSGKSLKEKKGAEARSGNPSGEWETRFRALRMTASNDYLKMAKKAVSAGRVSFGFGLLMQSLHENPDNPGARKILGYKKAKNGWQTDFETMNLRAGNVQHERFGWIPKKFVKKYGEGERFYAGKWISEEQDAQMHASIEKGWVVETGHFTIITDSSIEDAVRVGEKVEELYRVWKQLFLNYYATESQIRALFEKESAKFNTVPKHRICLFKTGEEYASYLTQAGMMVQGSVGMYIHRSTGEGVSCFVAGEENFRTMYHEVTHQLFEESCKTNPKNGERFNYWAIEAAATFMESFHVTEEGTLAVGGFDDERVRAARIYAVNSKVFIPFEEFTRVNRSTWQASPQVGRYYAQACGMAHFLVFYDHGKYRDAFGRILFDVYSGTDTAETVSQRTGASWETLNREYQEYISQNPADIEGFQVVE